VVTLCELSEKPAPDFGEAKFVPSWGGTVTGVRKFLIAYNVNMVCTKEQAHRFGPRSRSKKVKALSRMLKNPVYIYPSGNICQNNRHCMYLISQCLTPGPNPTTSIYKIVFQNNFFSSLKNALACYTAGIVPSCKFNTRRIGSSGIVAKCQL
jgi:hypothetical protein